MDKNILFTNDESFISFANSVCKQNLQKIKETPSINADFALIYSMLNTQHKIASIYLPVVVKFGSYEDGIRTILISTFYKNLFTFYSATELIKIGLYGTSLPILRYIFESVMFAKFCAVSLDRNLVQKWHAGDHINLTNHILNKIKAPHNQSFKDFLRYLHLFAHPTIYAQQISFSIDKDDNLRKTNISLGLLQILLECNYHILNTHLINSTIIYYTNACYSKKHEAGKILRKKIKKDFSVSRKHLSSETRKVVHNFKKSWIVKS